MRKAHLNKGPPPLGSIERLIRDSTSPPRQADEGEPPLAARMRAGGHERDVTEWGGWPPTYRGEDPEPGSKTMSKRARKRRSRKGKGANHGKKPNA